MDTRHVGVLAAFALALWAGGAASAAQITPEQNVPGVRSTTDDVIDTPLDIHGLHEQQHGTTAGHVPGSSSNVQLVGKIRLPRTRTDPGIITDVWSKGNYAYLGTFAPPCHALGVHIVDISNPASPQRVGFLPSRPQTRNNDVKVFSFNTPSFTGDLLLHSNENCDSTNEQRVGGISLWDVTNPLDPKRLAEGVGDTTQVNPDGTATILPRARQVHNIYAWQDGSRAYAAIVDDEELLDVDILDITDPRNPVHIAETGLPDWPAATVDGFGSDAFVHDIWAKEINGRWTLLLSYWDAGWVLLDVSDPVHPKFIKDSNYPDPDPLTGFSPEEGNAHAGVWDATGRFVLGGDEDFSPFRLEFAVTDGPLAGQSFPAGEFGFTLPISSRVDGTLNGPTVFGGYGCPDDRASIPKATDVFPTVAEGEERIIVFQRGPVQDPNHDHAACFFSDKIRSGEEAGYDAVIIANHHNGAGAGAQPDALICGGQGSPVLGTAHGLCIGHRFMHLAFGRAEDYTVPYPLGDPGDIEPNVGDLGPRINVTSLFDAWGYLHLLDASTLEELDAFAPAELLDPAKASGFGDLTMHNVETDPDRDLAYISWYSLGLRVVSFAGGQLNEVGHYIDANGNNFWGVHLATDHPTDQKLILASDRDSGLWIFRYTGP